MSHTLDSLMNGVLRVGQISSRITLKKAVKTPLMTRCVANLIQIMRELCMTAMVSPTGGRRIDLSISDIHFSALLDQELDHSSMAVERRVMEACARVIKARWDSTDLRPLFQ